MQASLLSALLLAAGAEAVVELTVEELEASLDDAWKTHRVVAVLDESAANVYTMYGNSRWPLEFPPAYQAALPFGAHTGGTAPAFWPLGDGDSQFDSWLTVGLTEGTSGELMDVGVEWDTWTAELGLSVDDGAVFWSVPDDGPRQGSEIVLAQLTTPISRVGFTIQFGLQGRSSAADAADWTESVQVELGAVVASTEPSPPGADEGTPVQSPSPSPPEEEPAVEPSGSKDDVHIQSSSPPLGEEPAAEPPGVEDSTPVQSPSPPLEDTSVAEPPAAGAEAVVELTVEELEASLDDAWKTHRVVAVLDESAANVYTMYGNSRWPLEFPPAYQAALPFGAHTGGTAPAFWPLGDGDSQFDSWLTVGLTEGTSGELMDVGVEWDTWTAELGLSVDDGAVFWSVPDDGPRQGSEIVLAQLTTPISRVGFTIQFGLQGRSSAADAADWTESVQVELGAVVASTGPSPPGADEGTPVQSPSPSPEEEPVEEDAHSHQQACSSKEHTISHSPTICSGVIGDACRFTCDAGYNPFGHHVCTSADDGALFWTGGTCEEEELVTSPSVCGANAVEETVGTAEQNRVCQCATGFFSPQAGGAEFEDCIPWQSCDEPYADISVSGTRFEDQLCTVSVMLTTVVATAVTDVDAFKAEVAAATGQEGAVVEITEYSQVLRSNVQLPGTISDYNGDVARAEFIAGVASALSIDASAIRSLTFTGSRRRQLVSHTIVTHRSSVALWRDHRQLQVDATATIDASYEVVTSDPLAATDLVAVTADPAAFTETLVMELNRVGTALPTLEAVQVTVAAPTVTTDISYAVTMESTSASASVEEVTLRLEQPAVMAQALSVATGTVVRQEDVVTTAQPVSGVDAPGSAQPGGGDGEDGGSLSIRLDISLILIFCVVVAAVCSLCLCCVKCRRRQGAAVKWTATAEQVDNTEGAWIVETEQWPGQPQQNSAEAIQQTATTLPAETVEETADELAATAPGAWADDRFDVVDGVATAGENQRDSSRDEEEGIPPPDMPPSELNLPQQEKQSRP